jgi:hypothetical protein
VSELVDRVVRIERKSAPVELRITLLADEQHGVVARWQLLRLGLSAQTVTVLMRSGLLQPVFRGVYGVARVRLDPRGRWMAAVLASGEEALLGGRSAVALWELRPAPAGPAM